MAEHIAIQAFLDLIAKSEGTIDGLDDGYGVVVSGVDGPHSFTDYSTHPFAAGSSSGYKHPIIVRDRPLLESTAAGRYQQILSNWVAYSKLLGLPDFGHDSQDAIAVQQIKEADAYDVIIDGNIPVAIIMCAHLWASFPGNNYNQHPHSLDVLVPWYDDFLSSYASQA